MKHAVFMLMTSLAVASGTNAAAQIERKVASQAVPKPSGAAPTQKQENAAVGKANSKTAAPAPNAGTSRPDNSNLKPSEPPKVKLLEINRLDDLHVQIVVSVNEAARQNAADLRGIAGSVTLNAEFDNGQIATTFTSLSKDTRRLQLELRPVTPNQNAGALVTAGELTNKENQKGAGSPTANSIGDKEKGLNNATVRRLSTGPRLVKATVKLSFSLKGGNQNIVITDELSRKF